MLDKERFSIAIVDDERDLVRTYEMIFKRRNVPLSFTALDGPEAVEKFRKADPKPGIIIIDYRLPTMSGLETMKEMLSIDPDTRIVFVSGDESVRQESLEAGATVFMKKPASIKEITEAISSLLNR